jgi:hypothetical protein
MFRKRLGAGVSVLPFLLVIALMITLPPMKSKQFIAGQEAEPSEYVKRLLDMHQRQQVLEDDDNGAHEGAASPDGTAIRLRKIDLTLFIVFHRQLLPKMYEGLKWDELETARTPNGVAQTTKEIAVFLAVSEDKNRTTVVFVAANERIEKSYDYPFLGGRLMKEWEMPGYDSRIGHTMNEFGAMNSIFRSNLTQHAGQIANVAGRDSTKDLVAADADGDGVQEWIGVFQYDMKLDSGLIRGIRRRIVKRSAVPEQYQDAYYGRKHRQKGAPLHCCIFYGISYPTQYALFNGLGRRLLHEYNAFFRTAFTLQSLPSVAIMDAFVVPSIVFNHFAPFLQDVMYRLVGNRTAYPAPRPSEGHDAASSEEVMEAALALALGLETRFVQVHLPLRHRTFDK